VYTDHDPLKYLTETAPKSAKLTRWSLALQEFNVTIQYKRGSRNILADALSRLNTEWISNIDHNIHTKCIYIYIFVCFAMSLLQVCVGMVSVKWLSMDIGTWILILLDISQDITVVLLNLWLTIIWRLDSWIYGWRYVDIVIGTMVIDGYWDIVDFDITGWIPGYHCCVAGVMADY